MEQKIIVGDLLEFAEKGNFDVIIHGCNCYHSVGRGVAEAVFKKYPEAIQADKRTIKGDPLKMGTYSYAVVTSSPGRPLVIINGYTQVFYGAKHYKGPPFDMEALERLLSAILNRLGGRGLKFGYPLIGSDRGKGDPEAIQALFNKYFKDENHTLVLFDEPGRNKNSYVKSLIDANKIIK